MAGKALRAASVLAALYGAAALATAGLMAARGLSGRPVTTPAQLLDPGLTFLVPGDELMLAPGVEPLVVTPALATAVAAGNVLVFGGAGLAWLAAALGMAGRRRWGRALGLVLFGGLSLVGLLNLAAEAALLALSGGVEAAGGTALALSVLGFTFVALIALPATGLLLLLRRGVAAACAGGGQPRPALEQALILHFTAAAALLLPAALAPASSWPPLLLLGTWLLAGMPARIGILLLAGLHAACAWGWWRRRRWTGPLSLWLNVALTLLLAASALAATRAAVDALGGGLLPVFLLRSLLGLAAVLGLGLILTIVRAMARTVGPVSSRPR